MLEILGFRKKNIENCSIDIYVNKEIRNIKIEHSKNKGNEASMILNIDGEINRYPIKDINNGAEVLSYLLIAVKHLGFELGREKARKDILTSLGIYRLINDSISERMDNI